MPFLKGKRGHGGLSVPLEGSEGPTGRFILIPLIPQ